MKSRLHDMSWTLAGAVCLLILMAIIFHFRPESAAVQVAAKVKRQQIVSQTRLHLESAVEAEKSSVLAITDQESQMFTDQARASAGKVERLRAELGTILQVDGERNLLDQFSAAFV
jgi:hypothetical protein